MEITISIPKNDYSTPTECRQEVVQAICDAFLKGGAWSRFRPHSSSAYRQSTHKVIANNIGVSASGETCNGTKKQNRTQHKRFCSHLLSLQTHKDHLCCSYHKFLQVFEKTISAAAMVNICEMVAFTIKPKSSFIT